MILRTLTLALVLFPLPAQTEALAPTVAAKAVDNPPVRVTLSFRGGTLAEFCAQIRQQEPRANIAVAALAANAKLPAIELRDAGLEQALDGACAVAESAVAIRLRGFRGQGEPVFTIMAQEPAAKRAATGGAPPEPEAAPTDPQVTEHTEVYSLNRLLDPQDGNGFAVTTVLSAVEAATGVEQQLAAMRFHKESGLLFVRGRTAQLRLVTSVLANLERDVMDRRRQADAKRGIPSEPTKGGK